MRLEQLLSPSGRSEVAAVTTTTSWDNGDEVDLTVGGTIIPVAVILAVPGHTHIVFNGLATDPTVDSPAIGPQGSHFLRCEGAHYMHHKAQASGDAGAMGVTILHNTDTT